MRTPIKKILSIGILMSFICLWGVSVFAQRWSWWDYWSDPMLILETVVDNANSDYKIQETALDGVTDKQWAYPSEYKISNTLEYIRTNIDPYFQWVMFIGLIAATIFLIYSGFMMVTNVLHKEGDWTKVKKNISAIAIGVVLMTGFYFIIKLVVALITAIFGWFDGSSWY